MEKENIKALQGIWHNPYGVDGLYDVQTSERKPRDPAEGEVISLNCNTWPIEMGQTVWVQYSVNSGTEQKKNAEWRYNKDQNSYWQAQIGPFNASDKVTYSLYASENGVTIGTDEYTFTTALKSSFNNAQILKKESGRIIFNGTFGSKLCICFPTEEIAHIQMSLKSTMALDTGVEYTLEEQSDSFVIKTNKATVIVTKGPGTEISVNRYDKISGWKQNTIDYYVNDSFVTKFSTTFEGKGKAYGFGEKYNQICQTGQVVDNYCYNQYQNQDARTYFPIPFYYSTDGYGFFLKSTYYSRFDMKDNKIEVLADKLEAMFDYYIITGENQKDIISNYCSITGTAQELPIWAFGLWMSANEWDRESEVMTAMKNAQSLELPATVLVLEQWSDEATFYIWNEAGYTPSSGEKAHTYSDFKFGEKWPSPKDMVNTLHNGNLHLILWQVPVLKGMPNPPMQNMYDEQYMKDQNYALKMKNGEFYKISPNGWFGNSLLLDFSNTSAVNWWMKKREYLFKEVGIDGIKPDGGEMVWGRNVRDGQDRSGLELRNMYPVEYINGYNTYVREQTGKPVTFSRSGYYGSQKTGIFWSGDQSSSFSSFCDAIRAGLTAGMSGVPFWSWDLSGFTGDFPSAELYKRCVQMAAFCPIMQFHSEKSNPDICEERSPWNVAKRTGDNNVINVFKKYANVRANLIPYIFNLMKTTIQTGLPMMRAMILEYPEVEEFSDMFDQYMFGESILVTPIVEKNQTNKVIRYPDGEWYDFWNDAITCGGETVSYYADENTMPVHIKKGSVIPMNLNSDYVLGESVGNKLDEYVNRVVRIYPAASEERIISNLIDIDGSPYHITVWNRSLLGAHVIGILAGTELNSTVTYQVACSKPERVNNGTSELTEVSNEKELSGVKNGYCYNMQQKLVIIKLDESMVKEQTAIRGVYKTPYDAEFAELANVTVNTNHDGYYGYGFVESFMNSGASVTFKMFSEEARIAYVEFRYSAGVDPCLRDLSVNNVTQVPVEFPATGSWENWSYTEFIQVSLNKGINKIKLSYGTTSKGGMNLDCMVFSKVKM